ncbi:hypothetical protein NQ315_012226 [Exocentrus adspersus]|uniref:Endonuclease/exonuclease/phosphatase domain-containing protein n=1 Tax=Exocentrus adspersus TaxID=1586481 RepID=A0AAV8VAU5_9CUCU|nr:hypothetical protein NQ315_012226 [Exocentrus adspersus]
MRKQELEEVLQRLEIDVMALQETRLAAGSQAKIPGYDLHRNDRNQRGGVAIAIKRKIVYYRVNVPEMDTMEVVAVGIPTERWGEITVASCYQPSGRALIEADKKALLSIGPRVIAIGDFNAKTRDWNSSRLNQAGAVLKRYLEGRADTIATGPEEPTFDGRGISRPDVLDIALLKEIPIVTTIESLHEGSSDHIPIMLTLHDDQPRTYGIVTKRVNWGEFREEIQRNTALPRIETAAELEAAVVSLETDIKTALERSTTETVERHRRNFVGELTPETKRLIRQRRAARRRALRTDNPEDRRAANQLSRRVKAALEEHFQENWRRHTESLDPQDRSMWRTQKALRNTTPKTIPPLQGERGVARTNLDKAEVFAGSLELQCRENYPEEEDEQHTAMIEQILRPPTEVRSGIVNQK